MAHQQIFVQSFGDLLKTYRKRHRLTQKHLAQQLGVHMNTVSSWELGTYLPATRGLVLELARCLALSELETRQLLEASLTALAPYWSVPFPRNPFFTGREEILETLHAHLHTEHMVALTQSYALHGLGGVGKTQIVLEYAYQYALEYSGVFWIGADTIEHITSGLLHAASTLQLSERHDANQQRVVAAVQRWLYTHDQWLLIWDNLEDLELLQRFLPTIQQGAVIITTRNPALGTLAQGIELAPMEQEEGMLLLLRRAKVLKPNATQEHLQQLAMSDPGEYTAATKLVTALGALPLALDQAGAYIEETGCNLAGYLQRYGQQRAYLLDRRGAPGNDHPQSVTTTFRLSMERVEREQHIAADLLRVCAVLHADAIPEELFLEGATYLGPTLETLAHNPCQLDQALAVLRSLSLVRRHSDMGMLSLHRLVQAVLRESMNEQAQDLWHRRVICALNALFPAMTVESSAVVWRRCERFLPHVLVQSSAIPDHAGGAELAQVLWKAADYLREQAQNKRAALLYERALHVGELAMGAAHPDLAYPLTGLAILYREQGEFEQAEPLFQHALQIREQALGLEHPLVAYPLMGLAILSDEQGKSELAEDLYTRALQIRERALGLEHPLVALTLNNMAIHYKKRGEPARAESLYERALSIQVRVLGPGHSQLARSLYNLANLYIEQGKYEQAEPLLQRSLEIGEQAWRPEHPNVAYPLDGLAKLYIEQEKHEQAEQLSRRTLCLWEQAWGPEHVLLADPLHNLAILAQRQGKHEQAERLLRRALRIVEQEPGPGHPGLTRPLNSLANLFRDQGNYEQAQPLYQRARSLCEQHLGEIHPETAHILHDLAIFHQRQDQLDEARSLAERALSIRSQSLGITHPKTIATHALYAQLLQQDEEKAPLELATDLGKNRGQVEKNTPVLPNVLALDKTDALQKFLDACCELHPLAWCRISDLRHSYEQWAAISDGRPPLSRRAFAAQVKTLGCRVDRTSTARIWRGIGLVNTRS